MAKPILAIIDGPSEPIQVEAEDSVSTVAIGAATWDPGTTVALECKTTRGSYWAPCRENGVPIVVSSNFQTVVEGTGYLRLNVSGIGVTSGLELSID